MQNVIYMFRVIIDTQRCKGCELCIEFCPQASIESNPEFNEAGYHMVRMIRPEDCTGCGMCALMCPEACIEIYREKAEAKAGG